MFSLTSSSRPHSPGEGVDGDVGRAGQVVLDEHALVAALDGEQVDAHPGLLHHVQVVSCGGTGEITKQQRTIIQRPKRSCETVPCLVELATLANCHSRYH